jgi:hypothetical protein
VSTQNTLGGKVHFMGSSFNVRYFGRIKCHLLNIGVKSANWWIVQGVKYNFQKKKKKTLKYTSGLKPINA